MLWLIFLFNNNNGSEKFNKRYMKTWRSLVLVMIEHETKTKLISLSLYFLFALSVLLTSD